eukprot:CAMPEP_0198693374 /NCGR_PEP_ID=MMETSP1468-20131203/248929_1 /TAXON_ID=1461545 /ORGANISM="Mantoniella sp, Strain CCMP1436" /LENGTH=197 /DNA_ID=CAMNT_0044447991 /DNA_START=82 /DNA_END=672 /DNA_ORIENTATION=+
MLVVIRSSASCTAVLWELRRFTKRAGGGTPMMPAAMLAAISSFISLSRMRSTTDNAGSSFPPRADPSALSLAWISSTSPMVMFFGSGTSAGMCCDLGNHAAHLILNASTASELSKESGSFVLMRSSAVFVCATVRNRLGEAGGMGGENSMSLSVSRLSGASKSSRSPFHTRSTLGFAVPLPVTSPNTLRTFCELASV